MKAHMIRLVDGPQPSEVLAANDAMLELPMVRGRQIKLTLLSAPLESGPALADGNTDNAESEKAKEQDDYVLGGYAGI